MSDFLLVVEDFLTKEECEEIVSESKKLVWEKIRGKTRQYDRIVKIDPSFADTLWKRLKPQLPKKVHGHKLLGLNSYFRIARYYPGMQFLTHRDEINIDDDGNVSLLTVNAFLKDGGAGTSIKVGGKWKTIEPKAGRAAIFFNQMLHKGDLVEKGEKWLFRTDVMSS